MQKEFLMPVLIIPWEVQFSTLLSGWGGTGMYSFHLMFAFFSKEMCPVGSRCPLEP